MPERTVLDPILLDLLACPQDKGPLWLLSDESGADILYNPRLRRAYPIDKGIPVLLVDDARDVSEAEHEKLVAQRGE